MTSFDDYRKIWQERQYKKSNKSQETGNRLKVTGDRLEDWGKRQKEMIDRVTKRLGDKAVEGYEEIKPGEVKEEMKKLRTEKTAKKVLKHSGTFIFIVSLASTIIILFPFLGTGTKKTAVRDFEERTIVIEKEDVEAKVIKEATALGLDARYSIYVPKIDAKSAVMENVDLENETEYLKALKKGVAHGKGTYFPGQGGNIFLFSHSVSVPEYIQTYNAVFYNLKDLEQGDDIIIYFSGVKYVYKVTEKIITSPRDVSFLTKDYGGETLILQTCDPPGTTLRRLLVIAKLG